MITHIRVASQQLEQPRFESPKELVSWMGAIQAQEYEMAKWAIGIRLRSSSLETVNEALYKGDILRTHVMRPTWHFVAAEDIRWMLMLSSERIKAAVMSYAKGHFGKIEKTLFTRCLDQIGKILEGYKSLTKQEVTAELQKSGILPTIDHVNLFLTWGEVEGIVCSGIDKGKKTTYALLDERVPPTRELCREEALARLASRYFQSHSPAQLQDFVWWSGLTATECRLAINLIKTELITETFDSREYFIHQSWKGKNESKPVLRLLPAFDEYLISYKNRTDVLPLEHHPKAFNRFGTFYPVILYNGKIIGNWSRSIKKNTIQIEMDFFEKKPRIPVKLIQQAEAQIDAFYRGLLYRPALQCREK
ncbi:winged helix DNA-binding domain-containing protein [Parabacteroides sp. AF27-14]|uniref:winged helix DNA-binding domain-containing protein n=1 Tax=Parabacteroides TaxID=375288 RepID=UPI000EFF1D27|nr:winged helix DNA-binding domain-containing protein [Parabacteroides sp. AF27-14]RKU53290.1 winged helix DNA-binding domain-containing protein [Parabacteroides sp. AF27-14]